MWEPADLNALPSPEDLIHANIAIKTTEEVLADARDRVAHLERDLTRRRAWVAPIRRLTSDVLSLIFEFCGEDQWKTTLRITEVSQQWRSLVLATPRAWEFLDIGALMGKQHMAARYLYRSGQRPLHVYLPDSMAVWVLFKVVNRLKCLSITEMDDFPEYYAFPILERLTLRSDAGFVETSYFNRTRFPSLRHFQCEPHLTCSPNDSQVVIPASFPPLETVSLPMRENPAWVEVLKACSNTLISLKLQLFDYFPDEGPKITLPALKCLEIEYWVDELGLWPLDLKTPALECYLESTAERLNDSPHHRDTSTVKKMRLDYPPALASFPALELLELRERSHALAVLSQLASSDSLSPKLQELELVLDTERYIPDLYRELEEVNRRRHQPIELVIRTHVASDLPYAITNSPCGENMPCNNDR